MELGNVNSTKDTAIEIIVMLSARRFRQQAYETVSVRSA